MNQILSTNNDNNYNNGDTNKIIKLFSIACIIIACIILAVAVISRKNNKGEFAVPQIEITRQQEKEITIKATCEDGINYIVYTWNEEKENRVNLNNSTNFERVIDIPQNSNNLFKIEVVSSKGIKGIREEEYKLDIDSNKPVIDEMTVSGSTLHIEASDNNGINYLAYKWEDEDERKIQSDSEDSKKITADINIKRGTYKLTVKIFDISGNKEEVSKLITGVNQPEIRAIKLGNVVKITVTHDMGFKRIEYLINDDLYVYDENYAKYDKEKTTLELEFPLLEGKNVVKVNAYSLEKLSNDEEENLQNYSNKFFIGECTYEQ